MQPIVRGKGRYQFGQYEFVETLTPLVYGVAAAVVTWALTHLVPFIEQLDGNGPALLVVALVPVLRAIQQYLADNTTRGRIADDRPGPLKRL